MRKTSTRLASLGLAAVVLAGCNTLGSSKPRVTNQFPQGHSNGYNFGERTQAQNPYNLERAVFFGDQFYVQARPTKERDELPFAFYPFKSVTRNIDVSTGKVTLTSDKMYVPRKVLSPCADDPQDQCYRDKITLSSNASKIKGRSVPGVKADITEIKVRGNDFVGSSRVTSEEDAPYGIMRTNILGNDYFFPHVALSKTNDRGKLPFNLMPVRGAQIQIKNDGGNMTLENKNMVFRPVSVDLGSTGRIKISPGVAAGSNQRVKAVVSEYIKAPSQCSEFKVGEDNTVLATKDLNISCIRDELRAFGQNLRTYVDNFKEVNPDKRFVGENKLREGETYNLPK
tara:strand:+ start:1297 stop:2319 length:1023 start_codon:yes stop_codon:yes gene_type:complete